MNCSLFTIRNTWSLSIRSRCLTIVRFRPRGGEATVSHRHRCAWSNPFVIMWVPTGGEQEAAFALHANPCTLNLWDPGKAGPPASS
jgi:hypothetical protein